MVLRRSTSVPTALLTLTVLLAALLGVPPSPASAAAWTPRHEDYPGTVTQKDLPITMSDGTVLRADLTLPADDGGAAVPGRWPVVVTITAYNKSMQSAPGASSLLGASPGYLVKRGYAQLTVDARGTGSSEGVWCAFCTRENTDAGEVMTWAAQQPWSNGSTAMSGPSYMGIDQIFAAAARPPGLKAIFPQVPAADVYRDVVASGGQVDVGFIPLWMGLVTGTGVIPPAVTASDPESGLTALAQHLTALGTFTLPMLFDRLQHNGVPVKMVIGPWNHLQASSGEGLDGAGHGSLEELQLRWFDHWVKGVPDAELDRMAPITYFEQGTDTWRTANR